MRGLIRGVGYVPNRIEHSTLTVAAVNCRCSTDYELGHRSMPKIRKRPTRVMSKNPLTDQYSHTSGRIVACRGCGPFSSTLSGQICVNRSINRGGCAVTRPDVLSSPSPVNFGLSSKNPFGPVRAICMRLGKYTAAKRDRITTTIQRRWLAEIVAKTKHVEYREVKKYWTKRLARVRPPLSCA